MIQPLQFSIGRLMAAFALFSLAMAAAKLPETIASHNPFCALFWLAAGVSAGLGVGVLLRALCFFALEGAIVGVLAMLVYLVQLRWHI